MKELASLGLNSLEDLGFSSEDELEQALIALMQVDEIEEALSA